jgi:hypothetical protein
MSVTFRIVLAVFLALPAFSEIIVDPAGDFLAGYTGPHNGDLDVLGAEVFYDGTHLTFTSTSAADIGTTPDGVFVWGVNRGAGFATFPVIAPGVTFDAVVILVPNGTSFVLDLATNEQTDLAASDVLFSGAFLSGRVLASLLPSLGVPAHEYTANLWPRSELLLVDEVISDFAPDNSNAAVTVIPEPGTFALLAAGAGILGLCRRRGSGQPV